MSREKKIKYSNSELVNKCNSLIRELSQSGGASWTLQIPVNFEKDPDVLFCEMGNRLLHLEAALKKIASQPDDQMQWKDAGIIARDIAQTALK
jgi:hypothetical protein